MKQDDLEMIASLINSSMVTTEMSALLRQVLPMHVAQKTFSVSRSSAETSRKDYSLRHTERQMKQKEIWCFTQDHTVNL